MSINTKMVNRTLRRVGDVVFLFPRGGTWTETRGVLSRRAEVDVLGNTEIRRAELVLTVPREDATAMKRGDRVVVGHPGTEYTAGAVETETSATRILLRRRTE